MTDPLHGWPGQEQEWLDTDYRLLTSLEGWTPLRRGADNALWKRRMPDDPNDLFLWRLPLVNAPPEVVFEALVHRILDYHQHWTKEFKSGRVVETLSEQARIVYQVFEPGLPGIAKRDLCHLTVTRKLSDRALLASYRTVDVVPPQPGFERIQWWGANLCLAGERPGTSALYYLDRENQGGWFPSFLMNLMMPGYLRFQYEHLQSFFAQGGPAELYATEGGTPPKAA